MLGVGKYWALSRASKLGALRVDGKDPLNNKSESALAAILGTKMDLFKGVQELTASGKHIMNEESFLKMEEQAEQELGPEARAREAAKQAALQAQNRSQEELKRSDVFHSFIEMHMKEDKKKYQSTSLLLTNLGCTNLKHGIQKVPIQRTNPFKREFGDLHENMFAYMLDELNDDFDTLRERLKEINLNLTNELTFLKNQIGSAGPRQSTKFTEIANQLERNTRARVSETLSSRRSLNEKARQSLQSPVPNYAEEFGPAGVGGLDFSYDEIFGTASLRQDFAPESHRPSITESNRISNRLGNRTSTQTQSNADNSLAVRFVDKARSERRMTDLSHDLDALGQPKELFHQIKALTVETAEIKEKQRKCYKRLEDLQIQLLHLIGDLEESVTYNPFTGVSTLKDANDGTPIYGSFVLNEDDEEHLQSEIELNRGRKLSKLKESMASLLLSAAYQLEKLRYIDNRSIYPRDFTLRLFDQQLERERENGRKLSLVELSSDRHLLLAFRLQQRLLSKIKEKMEVNKWSLLSKSVDSKFQLQPRLYQSFKGVYDEHQAKEPQESLSKSSMKEAIRTLVRNIKQGDLQAVSLRDQLNQHLLRLVLSDHKESKHDVQRLLQQEVFLTFKISKMNWSSLVALSHSESYYEVTMQLFFANGRPLSNVTMVPVLDQSDKAPQAGLSWIFLQVPMQVLINSDLALVLQLYKVTRKPLEKCPARLFGVEKAQEYVKVLEGWSTINLSATYQLSNTMGGQSYSFNRLRFFSASSKHSISDVFQSLTPEQVNQQTSSALLTQLLTMSGTLSFDQDYSKAKRRVQTVPSKDVDIHRAFERGALYSSNKDMQARFDKLLYGTFSAMQLKISNFKMASPPAQSLVKIEIYLVYSNGKLVSDCWHPSPDQHDSQMLCSFESEAKELQSRTDFREMKLLKLPAVDKVSQYKHYSLVAIIKIASPSTESSSIFRSSRAFAQPAKATDPFTPMFLCVLPLCNPEKKAFLSNGIHQPKVKKYNYDQLQHMLHCAQKHGDNSRLQQWMFSDAESEVLTLEVRLTSNIVSNIDVIDFLIRLNPEKLSVRDTDRVLTKMQSLFQEDPVTLLIHHRAILDRTFGILSVDYASDCASSPNDNGGDEDRHDMAFELLLLMIDLFHGNFPEYKSLLIKYLENHFYQPKVFMALLSQLHIVAGVFDKDISTKDRFWLTQTLSYLNIIVKVLRISWIQHQALAEKLQKNKMGRITQTDPLLQKQRHPVIEVANEEQSINDSSVQHDHRSASFGGKNLKEVEPSQGLDSMEFEESKGGDGNANFLAESALRRSKIGGSHRTESLMSSHRGCQMDSSALSDDNVLFNSNRHTNGQSMLQSNRTEIGQPEIFQTEKQTKLDQARKNFISGQLDRRTVEIKRQVRQDANKNCASNRISSFINNLGKAQTEKFSEEDLQNSVMESVINIFEGCHRDSYKITMSVREILLQNFHALLEEVSMMCGALTASSLISYLYCPISLKDQYKQLSQLDVGISTVFQEEEELRKSDISRDTVHSTDSFVVNVNSSFTSERESSVPKIKVTEDYIGGVHFPFGDEIDSSTTHLSLNQLRVVAMGKILLERTLQKIPGNSEEAIAETVGKFANYVALFGNVPSSDEISNDQLSLRIHVFFFLHQLMLYITKAESVSSENAHGGRSRLPSFGESIAGGNTSRRGPKMLVQDPESYLHEVVDIFMKSLQQLSYDVILFNNHIARVNRILVNFPAVQDQMAPFMPLCSIVLLNLISKASRRFIRKNFFNRPSILNKMIDNFNQLDGLMTFDEPFLAYIDKQRLDVMAQFNQNVSELIMEQFKSSKELPDLYIPVVIKLFFRYLHLWLNASKSALNEWKQSKKSNQKRHSARDQKVFNKGRLLTSGWELILKYKRKCLPDILQFRLEEHSQFFGPCSADKSQQSQVCLRQTKQKDMFISIFNDMHKFYEQGQEKEGIEVSLRLLLEAALIEFDETSQVRDSSIMLFQMFSKINYLKMEHLGVMFYINMLSGLLEKLAQEHTNLRIKTEAFKSEFKRSIVLLKDSFDALDLYNQNKDSKNFYMRALYGCRVIERFFKGRMYNEIRLFARGEFTPLIEEVLSWKTESAYLDLHCFELLQGLVDQGIIQLGEDKHIQSVMLSGEINKIVQKMVNTRNYAKALELNERVKMLYQRNYDLERILEPLVMETNIYKLMHKQTRVNYATYFVVKFLGEAHGYDFRDRTFIMRAKANCGSIDMIDDLRDNFDADLFFIEDVWPTEEQLRTGARKYCHLAEVKPLTLREIEAFDLHELVDRVFDDEDRHLLEKIQVMPEKLQNFYIQNFKNKFYLQESVRIADVDPVAYDQKVEIFTVKHKFPYIVGMQKVTQQEQKLVSCVRQAIKTIKDADNALSIIKKTVREQVIDHNNVFSLETILRTTLVAEINGGIGRYIDTLFTKENMRINEREDLLLKLYATMNDHFLNVQDSIELYSVQSMNDQATSLYYSRLSALKRKLQLVEKQTHASRLLEQREENLEVSQVQKATRVSNNLMIDRDSVQDLNNTFLIASQNLSVSQHDQDQSRQHSLAPFANLQTVNTSAAQISHISRDSVTDVLGEAAQENQNGESLNISRCDSLFNLRDR